MLYFDKIKFRELSEANKALSSNVNNIDYEILILSNITNIQLSPILEYALKINGIRGNITLGEFDNIVQESFKCSKYQCVIVIWEPINFISNYHENNVLTKEIIEIKKSEISLVLNNLKNTPLVIFNEFNDNFDTCVYNNSSNKKYINELNEFINNTKSKNTEIFKLNSFLLPNRSEYLYDNEYFKNYKMLYRLNFYWEYVNEIMPPILSVNGKSKKVLILDCDNTLWNGILGEDGPEGINMSPDNSVGKVFFQIQNILLNMTKEGVLLCICSKNNIEDVNNILSNHKDMILNNEHFAAKEVNWNNKINNIKTLSKKLNLSFESFVFLDDSDFEINLVKQYLPDVKAIKVPEDIFEYENKLIQIKKLFYQINKTSEDKNKTASYQQRFLREDYKLQFDNIDEYLISLEQKIEIFKDNINQIERLSQLTQKTNQFNLNTIRLTKSEINTIIESKNSHIFSIAHRDRFGDSGITGLSIVRMEKEILTIEQFLLSCRIIGRKVEDYFLGYIIDYFIKKKFTKINAIYKKSDKNKQVEEFYDRFNFITSSNNDLEKFYTLKSSEFKKNNDNFIEVITA